MTYVESDNEAPRIDTSQVDFEVAENDEVAAICQRAHPSQCGGAATDPEGSVLTWGLITQPHNEALFSLDAASGSMILTPGTLLDYEHLAVYEALLTVFDGEFSHAVQIHIHVKDMNDPPRVSHRRTELHASEFLMEEELVGCLDTSQVTDDDVHRQNPPTQTLSYALAGESALFGLNSSGCMHVKVGATLDFEDSRFGAHFNLSTDAIDGAEHELGFHVSDTGTPPMHAEGLIVVIIGDEPDMEVLDGYPTHGQTEGAMCGWAVLVWGPGTVLPAVDDCPMDGSHCTSTADGLLPTTGLAPDGERARFRLIGRELGPTDGSGHFTATMWSDELGIRIPISNCSAVMQSCPNVRRDSNCAVECSISPGVGKDLQLSLEVVGNEFSEGEEALPGVLLSYTPPVITNIRGAGVLATYGGDDIIVDGYGFGPNELNLDPPEVVYGPHWASDCWVENVDATHDRIHCRSVPGTGAGHVVQVQDVGGQSSEEFGEASYGPPVITALLGEITGNSTGGEVVTIEGA